MDATIIVRGTLHRVFFTLASQGSLSDCSRARSLPQNFGKFGRDERIRTSDPHTPSVMRYQAALRPDRVEFGAAPQSNILQASAYMSAVLILQAAVIHCVCGGRVITARNI